MKNLVYDYKLSASRPYSLYYSNRGPFHQKPHPDLHEAVHLGILLRGELRGVFCKTVLSLKEGDCYITGSWEPHSLLESCEGYELLLITVSPNELLKYFLSDKEKLLNLIRIPFEIRRNLVNIPRISAAVRTYGRVILAMHQLDSEGLIQRKWHAIIGLFMELTFNITLEKISEDSLHQYMRLFPAIRMLVSGQGKMISASEAASACGLSISRFSHLFRQNFGIPFGVYELQYRLNGAANELFHEGALLKDAASNWGFFDESHLSRAFKKAFGSTPGEYKKQI